MKSFVEIAVPDVLQLLARRIGLNPDSVGMQLIQAAVNDHMDELGLDDATAYVERLHGSGEFDELVERVVVPETWFFRDLEPYRCLQHFVREQWRPRRLGERLRVLSIPCSTGEEPYSIALTLLDLGLLPDQFRVDGVDISRASIQKARLGSFGRNSFREKQPLLTQPLESFFRRDGECSTIKELVRPAVHFTRANVASQEFLPDANSYHIIFCRNLLIYFVAEARDQALAHVRRLLEPAGYLYLGHAESGIGSNAGMEIADQRFPFAFRFDSASDASVVDVPPPPPIVVATPLVPPQVIAPKAAPAPRPKRSRPPAVPAFAPAPKPSPAEIDLLALARSAADAGQLDDAARHCQQFLAEGTPAADVFCLLGTIRQALGDFAAAETCFQKAVYLDPLHHESLVHLSLLAQRKGDARAAENFRRRAERAAKRSD